MNKRDEFKIELISNIDEEIIEKESVKRFSLMRKNRYSRKKIAGWCSVAACFLLTVSVVLAMLQPLLSKQAPVYEGMTVSSTMPELHGASGATFNDVARLMSTLSTAMTISRGNSDIFRTLTATNGTVTETDDPENAGNATEDTGDENGEIGDTGTTEGESGITLPEGIRRIESGTFTFCRLLSSVTLPKGLAFIGACAFDGCRNLRVIDIPASVTEIDREAFKGCTSVQDIFFRGTKKEWKKVRIGEDAFKDVPPRVIHCTDGDVRRWFI